MVAQVAEVVGDVAGSCSMVSRVSRDLVRNLVCSVVLCIEIEKPRVGFFNAAKSWQS